MSLQYNSQNTSYGIVGYAWSLSIPYIERFNKTGSQNLYATSSYFTSSTEGELAYEGATSTTVVASTTPTTPTVLDTLPVTAHTTSGTSQSFSYTPIAGTNTVEAVMIHSHNGDTATVSQNGVAMTCSGVFSGSESADGLQVCYLAAPTAGTLSIAVSPGSGIEAYVVTMGGIDQTTPYDTGIKDFASATSITSSITTAAANDLLLALYGLNSGASNFSSFNASEATVVSSFTGIFGAKGAGTWKFATSSGSNTMGFTAVSSGSLQSGIAAFKKAADSSVTVSTTTTTYRARIDDGAHNSYSFASNTWTVYDKSGNRYLYGSNDSARQYDTNTGTSTNTYKWMLQEVRDTNGNYITYTYNRDNNVLYPYRITYTGNGSTDGASTVTFATSTRSDSRPNPQTRSWTAILTGTIRLMKSCTYAGMGYSNPRQLGAARTGVVPKACALR